MITVSRRRLLLAGAGLAAFPARGKPGQLRPDLLPDPDFAQLNEARPYLIGVRPHRKGGVRLEMEEQPAESPTGLKHIIHNYGHGGGGITLSWGCASVATDLVAAVRKGESTVAVLGTGVIGLTVATELRRRWPTMPIAVYAKDLDVKTTTSFVAGGQFEPSGVFREYEAPEKKKALGELLRKSRTRIVEIQKSGNREAFGVAERKNYTLDHEIRALDVFTPYDVVPEHRKGMLPFAKLNGPGREYSNWLLNPTILLPKLAADLAAVQVKFEARTFSSREDVLALKENIVVNCTGLGAKTLFADENVIGQRGHLVVLKKTDDRQFYFFSGGCANKAISYVFCRQKDIVVGGTVIGGAESAAQAPEDEAVFAKILANGRELFAGNVKACKA